jgi:hypothetical protein
MVLVYGLAVYLLGRYRRIDRRVVTVLWSVVVLLSVIMVATSLALDWHWFADLIAGLIVGGIVLQLTVSLDHVVPDAGFAYGWRTGLRDVLGALRPRRPGAGDAATPQRSGVPEVTSPEQPPVVPRSGARSGSGHPETGSPARPG